MFDRYAETKLALQALLSDAGKALADAGVKTDAERFGEIASDLNNIHYQIAVLGFMKRGKSTLMNVLLRRNNDDIAPIGPLPCSSIITRYAALDAESSGESARVHYLDPKCAPKEIPLSKIREYNTEDGNPQNSKEIRHIDVFGDFPILNRTASLVDTPGKGSIHRSHDAIVDEFLPQADAIIFSIDTSMPIEAGEAELVKDLAQAKKDRIFPVLTKFDTVGPKNQKTVRQWVTQQLKAYDLPVHPLFETAAKPVYAALKEKRSSREVEDLAEQWGIRKLEMALEDHILRHSDKGKLVVKNFQRALDICGKRCRERLGDLDAALNDFTRDVAQLEAEKSGLEDELPNIRKKTEIAGKKFKRDWDAEVHSFRKKALLKSDAITGRIQAQLGNGGLLTAWQRKPAVMAAKAINEEFDSLSATLIERLEELAARLGEELDEEIDVTFGHRKVRSDVSAERANFAAKVIVSAPVVGVPVVAGTAAVLFMNAISNYITAKAALLAIHVGTGALPFAWGWLWGSNGALAAATAAKSLAWGSLVMTGVGGALAVCTTGLAIYAAVKITEYGLNSYHQNRAPQVVEEQMDAMLAELDKHLLTQRDLLAEKYSRRAEDEIEVKLAHLDDVVETLKRQDIGRKNALLESKKRFLALLEQHDQVQGQLQDLVKEQTNHD